MVARIYRPAKTAMQSGRARTKGWCLEFEPAEARHIDPLMGWSGSGDMLGQLRLQFESREQAVAYAEKHGIAYEVAEPQARKQRIKAYADNFAYNRIR